jgi:hypothetical protein
MIKMSYIFSLIFLFSINLSLGQDYSRKFYASVHYYAEQMLKSKIVQSREEVDMRKGKLFYYKVLDMPGNYAQVSGGYSGDYYMSLWKTEDGNDLLGVTHDNCEARCTFECSFFECNPDTIIEVTADIFPVKKMEKQLKKMTKKVMASRELEDSNPQFKFILPRSQGLLEVRLSINYDRIEFPIMHLRWTGSKFVVDRKFKEIPML